MQSREHAVVGTVVSALLVASRLDTLSAPVAAALVGYGVALSVLVDLDHFVVTRLLVGDWRHLRRVLDRPADVFGDQEWIFEDVHDFVVERLLTHAVLGGALVGATAFVDGDLAVFTAVVLYAHVLADLLRDNELL